MSGEKRNGAGSRLGGLLERPARPDQADGPDQHADGSEPSTEPGRPEPAKGRGGLSRKANKPEGRAAKVKGRTVYLHDDLFERIIVQAHRRGRTISDYVAGVLERQVPDHRAVRAEPSAEPDAAL